MKQKFSSLVKWVQAHRVKSLLIAGTILVVIGGGTAFAVYTLTSPEPFSIKPIKLKPRPKTYYSPLTGAKVKDEAATKQATTAIMIENSPDARPQSGLKDAGVVYETIAEGGITRFLAIYQQEKPQLVGPVRSLRMYYVDWLAPYNASVAHVGGSKAALDEVRGGSYRDIDQFFNPDTYWRASDRYAPHNVYTSFEKIDQLNQSKKFTTSSFKSFPREDGKAAETPNATKIAINFSSADYNTVYTYSKKSNSYVRDLGGAAHNDREKGRIAPSVVVALKVNMTRVMEDGYREAITTTGKGEAIVFQNGVAQKVTWQKNDRKSRLQLLDKEGKEIKLVRGQTWIAAVPNGQGSVSW